MFRSRDRFLVGCLSMLLCLSVSASNGWAIDPLHAQLSTGAPLVFTLEGPTRLQDHPLPNAIYETLLNSEEYRRYLDSPQLEPAVQLRSFLETTYETDWRTAIDRLTVGGVTLAVPNPGKEKLVLFMTTDAPESATKFVEFMQVLQKAEAVRAGEELEIGRKTIGSIAVTQQGDLFFAVLGSRLVIANDKPIFREVVRRLNEAHQSGLPEVAPTAGDAPLLTMTLDLEQARGGDPFQDFTTFPREAEVAQLAFFGGYADLFARGSELEVRVEIPNDELKVIARVDANRQDVTKGLEGFFASRDDASAPPLLSLPNEIATASWYRDYKAMWEARGTLLTEEATEAFEMAEQTLGQQLSVIGLKAPVHRLFESLGTGYRIAITRQTEIPYAVDPRSVFPQGVFAVSLRDVEQFEKDFSPFLRTFQLIQIGVSNQQGNPLTARTTDYKDAKLMTTWFRDDEVSAAKGGIDRFNFSPTVTIARDHFIIGSTEQIVMQTIDELDRLAEEAPAVAENVTERIRIGSPEGAKLVNDLRDLLVQNLVFDNGFTVQEAEAELKVLRELVGEFGELTTTHQFTENGFEIRLEVSPSR